jgi:hypothetical protein
VRASAFAIKGSLGYITDWFPVTGKVAGRSKSWFRQLCGTNVHSLNLTRQFASM